LGRGKKKKSVSITCLGERGGTSKSELVGNTSLCEMITERGEKGEKDENDGRKKDKKGGEKKETEPSMN